MRILAALFVVVGTAWGQVASMTITDLSGSTQTARPFLYSRVFACGDIPFYPKPRINGVSPALWQVNVLTRWGAGQDCADGSVRQAEFATHSDISAGGTLALDFVNDLNPCYLGSQSFCDAAASTSAAILAMRSGAWSATAELTNGSTQIANARTMIAAGYWRYWIRGPVATQIIVEEQGTRTQDLGFSVATAGPYNGSVVQGLHPQFIVTVFPAYTAGIRLEYIIDNTWTDKLVDQSYALAVKTSAGTVYSRPSFTHYAEARWHKGNEAAQIWDGTAPGAIQINHNLAYLVSTKALQNYDTSLSPSTTSILANYNASDRGVDFGGRATVYLNMNTTGARPDVGPVYLDQLKALYSGSATLDPMLYYLGDVAGHVPIHFREHRSDNYLCSYSCTSTNATVLAQGYPINPQSRPTFNAKNLNWSSTTALDKVTLAGTVTKGGWIWDQAHHPSLTYIPYLLTGSPYYLQEMQFWASYCKMDLGPEFRNMEWALGNPKSISQRAAAWQLRTIGQAAFLSLDGSPERQMWMKHIEWDAEMYEGIQAETSGNYPPSDSSCPGHTAANYTPLSGPNRSRWCYGKFYANFNHPNPLHLQLAVEASIDCQATYWAKFDCSNTYTGRWIAIWQQGYWLVAAGWINEAVSPAFSKVLENYHSAYIDAVATTTNLRYTMLGGMWSIWTPNQTSGIVYPTTFAQYENFIVPAGIAAGTTMTGSTLSASGTSFTVADYTKLSHKPIWNRTGASGAITAISSVAGTITLTFRDPPGLAVGDRIQTNGHSVAGLNTGGTVRNITAVPSSTQISYQYVGTLPADGSYTVESAFFAKTPGQNLIVKLDSENVQVCNIETNGVVTIGVNTAASSVSGVCTATLTHSLALNGVGTRGVYYTTAASHTAGAAARAPYEIWQNGDNLSGGYNWILRAALSYAYGRTTGTSTGAALWTWLETNMKTPLQSFYDTKQEPCWAISPRGLASFTITTAGLPTGTVNSVYSQPITTSGATGAVACSLQSGTLPAGIVLSGTGNCTLIGTPTAVFSGSITVRVMDSTLAFREATYGLSITGGAVPIISPLSLPSGTDGSAYSQTISATGTTAPYTFSKIGTWPAWANLSSGGVLSGTAVGGTFNFTVRATDALNVSSDQLYSLTNAWQPLVITTATRLTNAQVGVPYTVTLATTGGSGGNAWLANGGTLPPGTTWNSTTGRIDITATTTGDYNFTFRVTDSAGTQTSKAFDLTVIPPVQFRSKTSRIKASGRTVVR